MPSNNTKCVIIVLYNTDVYERVKGEKMDNKEIINKVVKEYFTTGHLSESILKNNRDVKEDRLLKIYKNKGDIK